MALPEFPLNVPDHAGQPADPQDVYFGEVDAIGKIQSACSNLNRVTGVRGRIRARVGMVIGGLFFGGVLGAALGGLLSGLSGPASDSEAADEQAVPFLAGGAALGLVLGLLLGRPWEVCTFVGERGLARVRRKGERSRQQILKFEDAAELRQQLTRVYFNGVYAGTNFRSEWLGRDGKTRFKCRGGYRERKNKPIPPGNEYAFAQAAALRWNAHVVPAVLERLGRGEKVRFNVGRNKWIDVGQGFMEFGLRKQPLRLEPADVKSFTLARGVLTVKPKGSGWRRPLSMSVGTIGNSSLFLNLLEKTYNVRF